MPQLKELCLFCIEKIEPTDFENLDILQILVLRRMIGVEIKEDTFINLKNLRLLDLSWNENLTSIHPNAFRDLDRLAILDISRTQLFPKRVLKGAWLSGLNSLAKLIVRDCSLKNVDSDTFVNMTNLRVIDLTGNSALRKYKKEIEEFLLKKYKFLDRVLL